MIVEREASSIRAHLTGTRRDTPHVRPMLLDGFGMSAAHTGVEMKGKSDTAFRTVSLKVELGNQVVNRVAEDSRPERRREKSRTPLREVDRP